jgi:NAD(P)-dependent dehydrogenase (short-subunit alcohol dehydrogenase family)
MTYQYSGTWALVTGAGIPGRIGAAIAERLARAGANIYLHDIKETDAMKSVVSAVEKTGVMVRPCFGDLTRAADVQQLFESFENPPDIIVNNAGIFRAADVRDGMSLPEYLVAHERAIDINVAVNMKSAFLVTEAAVYSLKKAGKSGVIVFEGDAFLERAGSYPRNLAAYAASKMYIPSVVHQLAEQHGREGIRFLGVLNGTIEPPATAPQSTIEHMQREIPLPAHLLNPWLGAASVADAIVNLIQMEAVNGTTLTVDGGRTWTTKEEL